MVPGIGEAASPLSRAAQLMCGGQKPGPRTQAGPEAATSSKDEARRISPALLRQASPHGVIQHRTNRSETPVVPPVGVRPSNAWTVAPGRLSSQASAPLLMGTPTALNPRERSLSVEGSRTGTSIQRSESRGSSVGIAQRASHAFEASPSSGRSVQPVARQVSPPPKPACVSVSHEPRMPRDASTSSFARHPVTLRSQHSPRASSPMEVSTPRTPLAGAEVDVFLGSGERPDICNPIGGHKPISGGDRFPLTSERVVRRAGVLLRGPAQKSTARPASPPEVGLGGWARASPNSSNANTPMIQSRGVAAEAQGVGVREKIEKFSIGPQRVWSPTSSPSGVSRLSPSLESSSVRPNAGSGEKIAQFARAKALSGAERVTSRTSRSPISSPEGHFRDEALDPTRARGPESAFRTSPAVSRSSDDGSSVVDRLDSSRCSREAQGRREQPLQTSEPTPAWQRAKERSHFGSPASHVESFLRQAPRQPQVFSARISNCSRSSGGSATTDQPESRRSSCGVQGQNEQFPPVLPQVLQNEREQRQFVQRGPTNPLPWQPSQRHLQSKQVSSQARSLSSDGGMTPSTSSSSPKARGRSPRRAARTPGPPPVQEVETEGSTSVFETLPLPHIPVLQETPTPRQSARGPSALPEQRQVSRESQTDDSELPLQGVREMSQPPKPELPNPRARQQQHHEHPPPRSRTPDPHASQPPKSQKQIQQDTPKSRRAQQRGNPRAETMQQHLAANSDHQRRHALNPPHLDNAGQQHGSPSRLHRPLVDCDIPGETVREMFNSMREPSPDLPTPRLHRPEVHESATAPHAEIDFFAAFPQTCGVGIGESREPVRSQRSSHSPRAPQGMQLSGSQDARWDYDIDGGQSATIHGSAGGSSELIEGSPNSSSSTTPRGNTRDRHLRKSSTASLGTNYTFNGHSRSTGSTRDVPVYSNPYDIGACSSWRAASSDGSLTPVSSQTADLWQPFSEGVAMTGVVCAPAVQDFDGLQTLPHHHSRREDVFRSSDGADDLLCSPAFDLGHGLKTIMVPVVSQAE